MTEEAGRASAPRALAAAVLSVLLPGLGHLLLRRWRRSLVFLAVDALAIAGSVWVVSGGTVGVLQLLVQPRWVRAVIAGNLILALFRLVAVVDVFIIGRPRLGGFAAAATGFVLVVALVAPHIFVMTRSVALLDVLETVFPREGQVAEAFELLRLEQEELARVSDPLGIAVIAQQTAATVTPTTLPLGAVFPDGLGSPRLGAPDPTLPRGGRITVLLAGGDAGPGRSGLRTDTMVVASLNLVTRQGALISISREFVHVPLPRHLQNNFRSRQDLLFGLAKAAEANGTSRASRPEPDERDRRYFLDRINAVYPFARNLTSEYPDEPLPGMAALRDTLSFALALPIDYYVLVDMAGFVDLVDALGGVWVTSQESMHVRMSPPREGEPDIVIQVEPGRYHLDGRSALAYVRNRIGTSDLIRTRRQRCFIREVVAQVDPKTVVFNFEKLAAAIAGSAQTDIPLTVLPALVQVVAALGDDAMATMAIEQGAFSRGRDYRGLPVFDAADAQAAVRDVITGLDTGIAFIDAAECGESGEE